MKPNNSKSKAPVKQESEITKVINKAARKVQRFFAPVLIFVAVILGKKVKGKLGFNSNIADGNLIIRARAIFDAITADTGGYYTAIPFAQLAQLDTLATQFEQDCTNVKNGVLGAEEGKQFTRLQLIMVLDLALAWINQLAYFDQDHAGEIITGASMVVITRGSIQKDDFEVREGFSPGLVILISRALKLDTKYLKASYEWQYSLDNGVTWISLPITQVAKTTAPGMPVGVKILFRKRASSTKTGVSDWSPVLGITL